MKHLRSAFSALAIACGVTVQAADLTLPEQPDIEADYRLLIEKVHNASPDAEVLMNEFLVDYASSYYTDYVHKMLGDYYFYRKDYKSALAEFSLLKASEFSGDVKEEFLYHYAYSLIKCGYYPEARLELLQLAGSNPYADAVTFYLAYLDYLDGNYDKAYDGFKKVKNTGKRGLEAEYYMNQIDFRRGDYRKVVNASERLLAPEAVPEELRLESVRITGISNFKLGNIAAARNQLSRYVEEAGESAEASALYTLATIYYDEGNYDAALPLFIEVTDDPGVLAQSAYLYIGQICLKQGYDNAAAIAFNNAANAQWNDNVAEVAAYNLAVATTRGPGAPFADSAKPMADFVAQYPNSSYAADVSSYLANAYYNRHDYVTALSYVDKLPADSRNAKLMRQKIYYRLGVQQLKEGDTAGAIVSLSQASAVDTPDKSVKAEAALWLGDAYYKRKNYADAVKAYNTALTSGLSGTNKASAYYNLGYCYFQQRDYKSAEKNFASALNTGSLSSSLVEDARLRRADCLYYTGNYSEALAMFESLTSAKGQTGVYASIRKSDILGKQGRVSEKISLLETLAASDNDELKSTVLSRLADAYSENGEDAKAATVYTRLIDAEKSEADRTQAYYALATNAQNLFDRGQREAAYDAYCRLEESGIPALKNEAVIGIMRTAPSENIEYEYADKVLALPAVPAEVESEARLVKALQQLNAGATDVAESQLLDIIDAGAGDDNEVLARAYIALADVYTAQGKDYLARMYLETLRDNYPGENKEILNMIVSRLK